MTFFLWATGTVIWLAMGYALAEVVRAVVPQAAEISPFAMHVTAQLTWPFWLVYGLARKIWL